MILNSKQPAEHLFAGRNTQQAPLLLPMFLKTALKYAFTMWAVPYSPNCTCWQTTAQAVVHCYIFRPAFGCCALQILVEILNFNISNATKLKKENSKKYFNKFLIFPRSLAQRLKIYNTCPTPLQKLDLYALVTCSRPTKISLNNSKNIYIDLIIVFYVLQEMLNFLLLF